MSTVMKSSAGPMLRSPMGPLDKKQLRRDRWTAVAVVAVVIVMMALIVWLASMGGGVAYEAIEYWPMMP